MRRWLARKVLVFVAAVATPMLLRAQRPQPSDQKPLAFEVASIKSAPPFAPRPGRLGSIHVVATPDRLSARNATLKDLVRDAYSLDDYQVVGGPAWTSSARYDVDAKAAGPANREQLLFMLQTLLKERFMLVAHRDSRELSIYAVVLANDRPKFQPLDDAEQACYPMCEQPAPLNRLRERDVPSLARYLTRLGPDRPVIDRTGLTGTFKIELDMQKIMGAAMEGSGPPSNDHVFRATVDAVHDELGLTLKPTKAPVDVLVIDHVEKPTPD